MGSLHQYFEMDFNHAVKMHVKFPSQGEDIESIVVFDFTGLMAFFACYVKGNDKDYNYFKKLLDSIEYGKSQVTLDGKVTLPSAKHYPGELRIENNEDFQILSRFHGEFEWVSSRDINATRRTFIYSESDLTEEEMISLRNYAKAKGHDLQFRSLRYMNIRSANEKPLAFISHDSRDKELIARNIAFNLQKMLCPVWYDEYSLKIGDNLRESIEKGLKECKKCILILSPNFLSNNGWTKKEFDSIFTRELIEEQKLILPVWYKVTKQEVYEYSPSLANIYGGNWENDGEDKICRMLFNSISE